MVRPNFYRMFGTFEEVLPFFESPDDGQQFFVVDFVIAFYLAETLGVVGYRVPLAVRVRELRQYSAGREVRAVCLDSKWLTVIRKYKYGGLR